MEIARHTNTPIHVIHKQKNILAILSLAVEFKCVLDCRYFTFVYLCFHKCFVWSRTSPKFNYCTLQIRYTYIYKLINIQLSMS